MIIGLQFGDQKSMINLTQFEATIWTTHNIAMAMDQSLENYDFGLKDANVQIMKKNTVINSHKCNQCDYVSSKASHLTRHLKTHSGEKLNKCNQCDYASYEPGNLRRHLKTHSEN